MLIVGGRKYLIVFVIIRVLVFGPSFVIKSLFPSVDFGIFRQYSFSRNLIPLEIINYGTI
jgi:hypothetical protein